VGTAWTDIRIGVDIDSGKKACFSISDGSSAVGSGGPNHTLTTEVWHHVVATYDNDIMSLYVNGAPATGKATLASTITPKLSDATVVAIGGNGSEKGECNMCDVRIYDHALSQAEIKELSKALVLHYSFNDLLSEGTTNLNTPGVNSWGNLGGAVTYTNTGGLYRLTSTTAGPIRLYFPLTILTNGASYAFSCKYRKISGEANWNLTDWCDLALSNSTVIDCGDHYYLSAICPARNYDSTYRFLDSNISANSVIEVWDI
jgi:hypothetical protein